MENIRENDFGVVPLADDAHSALLQARLLRRRGEWDQARALLEQALGQWPQNQEVRDLLLQTEKDQLSAKRRKGGDDSAGFMSTGLVDDPRQLVGVGLIGLVFSGVMLFKLVNLLAFMIHFGFAAPHPVYGRWGVLVYHVPAYTLLTFPLIGLGAGIAAIFYVVRGSRL